MRSLATKVSIVAVAVLLAAVGLKSLDHGRETSYIDYLRDHFIPSNQLAHFEAHHDLFLAEGQAACEWIAQFPQVPDIVPDGSADPALYAQRYIDANPSSPLEVAQRRRMLVDRAAWYSLCDNTGKPRVSGSYDEDRDPAIVG